MPHFELDKHNFSPTASLEPETNVVIYEKTVSKIIDDIREQISSGATKHYLLIGQHGSGRTSMLRLLTNRILNDPDLSALFLPIVFSEEEYSITTLHDFMVRILEILFRETKDDSASVACHNCLAEPDDEVAIDGSLAFLQIYAAKANKKLLLLIDNYEQLLKEHIKSGANLKRMKELLSTGHFIVVAGATPSPAKKSGDKSDPLRELFSYYSLDELDFEETESFLLKQAKLDRNEEVIRKIPLMGSKLKALRHLIGRTPRISMMVYRQLSLRQNLEILPILQALLDDLTPEYKHKFEWLSPQARKVLDAIAKIPHAVTPTEIARYCRLPVNQVTSTFTRLQDGGYITLAKQERRKVTYYILSDRLFRLWYQMRSNSANRKGVINLVEFLSFWYEHIESKQLALPKQDYYSSHIAGKLYYALRMLESGGYAVENLPEDELAGSFFKAQVMDCLESEQWDLAEEELNRQLDEHLAKNDKEKAGAAYYALALFHHQRGLRDFAEEHFLKALKSYARSAFSFPGEAVVFYNWGYALTNLARLTGDESLYREAFEKYRQAIVIRSDFCDALSNWGNSLAALARMKRDDALFGEALAKYQQAIEIKPDKPDALNNWGNTLTALARLKRDEDLFQEAFSKYQQAVHVKPDMHDAFYNWGTSLAALGRIKKDANLFQEAAAKFKQAVRIEPAFHEALNNWGNALAAQAQLAGDESLVQSAIARFQQAARIRPNKHEVLFNWGLVLTEQAHLKNDDSLFQAAFDKFREAAGIRPDLYYAIAEMGFIMARKGDLEQALPLFERALYYARKMNDQEACAALSKNMFQVLRELIVREVIAHNVGQVEKLFQSFLSYKDFVGKQEWSKKLLDLFASFLSKSRTEFYFKMQEILREKCGDEQVQLLLPISKAYEFWRDGENSEILDRLNSEVREIVEDILARCDDAPNTIPVMQNLPV